MKTILMIALATLATPVSAKKPTDLLTHVRFNEVARKLNNLAVTGCYLDQGDRVEFFRTKGSTYAVNRKSFASVYRDSGRDIETTLIALDAGGALCRVAPLK